MEVQTRTREERDRKNTALEGAQSCRVKEGAREDEGRHIFAIGMVLKRNLAHGAKALVAG